MVAMPSTPLCSLLPTDAMHRMFRFRHLVWPLLAALFLAACGGGPPKRVFPPDIRVQEIRLLPPDRLEVLVRIQSYSTVPMRFDRLDLRLALGDTPPFPLVAMPASDVLPGAAESVAVQTTITQATSASITTALSQRRTLPYRVDGHITAGEPKGRYDVDYRSVLSPAPGLEGVMR